MANDPIFLSEEAARAHLETLLWPEGPICPHCGSVDNATALKTKTENTRPGVYKCRDCEAPFTVTVGTIYESSHIPLAKWVYATHLMNASKKGISALQLQRMLGLGSYRTAWFMAMRIRESALPFDILKATALPKRLRYPVERPEGWNPYEPRLPGVG